METWAEEVKRRDYWPNSCADAVQHLKAPCSSMRTQAALWLARVGEPWTIGPLLEVLELDRDEPWAALAALQANTLRALSIFGESLAAGFLIASLSNPALLQLRAGGPLPGLIRRASAKLGRPGWAGPACAHLKEYGIARVWAIMVLGEMRARKAVEPLSKVLLTGVQWNRMEAVQALGEIGDSDALPCLTRVLADSHEDPELRMEAAIALGKIGDWGATPTLRRALEPGENLAVLRAATWALRQLGDSQAVFPLCDLLRACSGEGLDLGFVAEALGDFEGPAAVAALCRVLDEPDARTAEAAAESLGRIGDPEALDALIRASGVHHGIWVRDASIGAMGRIGTSRALPPLVRLLSDCSEPAWLRATAAHALAEARLTDAVPALLKALGDGEPGVVCAAIRALSILEVQGAILPICRVMIARHDLSLDEVKMALGGIPRAKLVEALNAALGIQDASVSEDMAEALMGIWDSLPEKPLRRLLQSPDARVSGWAKTVWEYCQE